jgi:hypothetical protein
MRARKYVRLTGFWEFCCWVRVCVSAKKTGVVLAVDSVSTFCLVLMAMLLICKCGVLGFDKTIEWGMSCIDGGYGEYDDGFYDEYDARYDGAVIRGFALPAWWFWFTPSNAELPWMRQLSSN